MQRPILEDPFLEGQPFGVLEDDVELAVGVDVLEKPYNIRMARDLQDPELSLEDVLPLLGDPDLFDDLDCDVVWKENRRLDKFFGK
jgi:hypothetical protein